MTETIILVGVILFLGIINYVERQKATKRENDLLNRLMSRDFREYVHGKTTMETKDTLLKSASPQELMDQVNRIEPENRDAVPVD